MFLKKKTMNFREYGCKGHKSTISAGLKNVENFCLFWPNYEVGNFSGYLEGDSTSSTLK
jgi:hypothetical protein